MLRQSFALLAAAAVTLSAVPVFAQTAPTAPPITPAPIPAVAPVPNAVAATVNGQPIAETALQRGLKRVPAEKRAVARTEILNFLIDNVLIEQYLLQLKIEVDAKVVDKKIDDIRAEIKNSGKEWENWLAVMQLTDSELKQHITADLRWNQYATSVATDKVLKELFDGSREMFDGTQVHARHILLLLANDPKAAEKAIADLRGFKQTIEQQVAAGVAKLPATTAPLEREKARQQLLEDAFSAIAQEKSSCPSKSEGGDLHYFPRISDMVEPFSKAAFALKPFEMSDVVQTQFGYHLILVTERTGTREVKFEDQGVKSLVLEVYCDKLREAMVTQARQKSKIEIAKP